MRVRYHQRRTNGATDDGYGEPLPATDAYRGESLDYWRWLETQYPGARPDPESEGR